MKEHTSSGSPSRSLISSNSSLPRSPQLQATFCYNSIAPGTFFSSIMRRGSGDTQDSRMLNTLSPSPRLGEQEQIAFPIPSPTNAQQNLEPNSVLTANTTFQQSGQPSKGIHSQKVFNYKLLGMESRIVELQRKLASNEELVKLSQEMVRLKQSERAQEVALKKQELGEMICRIEKLEHRVEGAQRRMDQMEKKFQMRWEQMTKRIDSAAKQSQVVEIVNSKFDSINSQFKELEQRMKELVQARIGEVREESDFRNRKLLKSVEELGDVAHRSEMQMLESKESVRTLNSDYHTLLRFMNEFKTRLGYFEWTTEEIKQLKRRQMRIIERLAPGDLSQEGS